MGAIVVFGRRDKQRTSKFGALVHSVQACGEFVRKSRNRRGLLGVASSGGAGAVDMTASDFARTTIGGATIQAVNPGGSVILNTDCKNRVAVNNRFEIARIWKEIRRPITQEVLGIEADRQGCLLITEVRDNIASGVYSGAVAPPGRRRGPQGRQELKVRLMTVGVL